ncbi:hypothetical protein CWB99_17945 [Pseudoalteromonas rubra]|uniref:Uncharacterized protein n=1 Tax=Pseudoalteromonas rubra TaxID=43658 RepID=A0A5S3WHR7_9GAMM|nr:hypothetical protein CWB99_17945 [Pseudoalteromonas rubra]TMP30714.1 hypothetical protein CWC00_16175 [Pseudoalteromonas rubra]
MRRHSFRLLCALIIRFLCKLAQFLFVIKLICILFVDLISDRENAGAERGKVEVVIWSTYGI